MSYYYGWKPYVPVAEQRKKAAREMAKLRKSGGAPTPVTLPGRKIATTFWGEAWCNNLESYSDFSNRLPRGKSYLRNGRLLDLQVNGGDVSAMVSGSRPRPYKVTVTVAPIPKARWNAIRNDCAGSIDSLVELLQGRLSAAVMERVCRQKTGLFPAPGEIKLACSCPDWASMCKHVAAVLYGIGARLDERPELMFKLRAVDERQLIAAAAQGRTLGKTMPPNAKVLDGDDLTALFGLEMEQDRKKVPPPTVNKTNRPPPRKKPAKRRAPAKKAIGKRMTAITAPPVKTKLRAPTPRARR